MLRTYAAHATLAGSSGGSGACSPVSSNSAALSVAIPTAVTRECAVMSLCRASSSAVPRAASVAHVSCASVLAFSTISGRLRIKAATADQFVPKARQMPLTDIPETYAAMILSALRFGMRRPVLRWILMGGVKSKRARRV